MVVAHRESRRLRRTRFSAEQHFDALDDDADSHDIAMEEIRQSIHTLTMVNITFLVTASAGVVVGTLNLLGVKI